jgi:hypothetical protein
MIRDFPNFPIGWRDSYILCSLPNADNAQKRAIKEVEKRGGKYGAVLYENNVEILQIPQNYKP